MSVIIKTPALSKQADAYVIKNPREIKNAHSINNADDAAVVLRLSGDPLIRELKDFVRQFDFTSISTRELAMIGSKLYENDLIDEHVASIFTTGNMAVDRYGRQTAKDVRYNAIAMFNQMLGDNKEYARTWPMYAHQESFKNVTMALQGANQAINALSYFARSARSDLSVSIQA